MAIPSSGTRDWDDAYVNGTYISNSDGYVADWAVATARFRDAWPQTGGRVALDVPYGNAERERYDLFLPAGEPLGLIVFVHGGYWKAFDRSSWSHLAAGALAHGLAVAMPGYTLCPEARIADIAGQVARGIAHAAARVAGPIGLTGHSAGGQLAARLAAAGSPLDAKVAARIAHVLPISGVHDLRPLRRTQMNDILRLDAAEAARESPVLLEPRPGLTITCWVGADERPEFVRQNHALAAVWGGFDCTVTEVVEPGRHHYDIIAGLAEPEHPLTRALVDPVLAQGLASRA